MTIRNHYGIYVDTEVPVTGVGVPTQAVYEAEYDSNSVDLSWEDHIAQCDNEYHDDCYFADGDQTVLIGGWLLDDSGLYSEDTDSEFSAIVRGLYVQVTHSQYVRRCAMCSPCYPGQGDLDSVGVQLTYALPPEFEDDNTRLSYALFVLGNGAGL